MTPFCDTHVIFVVYDDIIERKLTEKINIKQGEINMRRLKGKIISLALAFALVLSGLAGFKLPAEAAAAPAISISTVVESSYGVQSFSVYAESAGIYEAYDGGALIGSGELGAGTTTLSFNSGNSVLLRVSIQYDGDDDGYAESWNQVQAYSAAAYYTTVTCMGSDGTFLQSEQVLLDAYNYPSYTYTAPASFDLGDVVYTTGSNMLFLQYGDGNQTITYTSGAKEARSFSVTYLDENDEPLYSENVSLNYGESYTLSAPASYEANGKSYQLESSVSSYDITYDNAASAYVFEYAQVIPAPAEPYEITINLVDSENDNALLYSLRQTVDVDSTVRVELPSTYEVNFKQYVLAEGVENFIERSFDSTRSAIYTIPYVVAGESAPYDITVNFVDYDHPETVLSAMTATVTADGAPFTYDVNSAPSLEINGVQYHLLSGQGNDNGQIVHTYGTAVRSYNVYYAAQEDTEPQAYTVTLRYISIDDNSVLETQEQQVAYGSSVSFETAPEELTVGNTEYILLNGQDTDVTHDYNESQTNYAVYYRDASVEVEEEPEVITQVVTQYVTEDDGTVAENADGTAVPVNVPVTTVTGGDGEDTAYNEEGQPVNIEDGNIVTLDDEDTPLAGEPDGNAEGSDDRAGTDGGNDEEANETAAADTVTIEDETTPLAALPDNADSSSSSVNMPLVIVGTIIAVVVIAGVCVIVVRKRKNMK